MAKTVLITGTSSGLGRATAKLFQAEGWNVVATLRSPEAEAELNALDRVLVARLEEKSVSKKQAPGGRCELWFRPLMTNGSLGPGKIRLMQLVSDTGSASQADAACR